MSRIIISIFLLITTLLLTGCLNEGENKRNTTETSSKTLPSLRITAGEDTFTPVRGSYNWSYSNGDGTFTGENATSAAPPVLVNKQQVVTVTSDTKVKLNFEEAPQDYKVKIWDSENNEVKSSYDEMVLPQSGGKVIYEILASWEHGTVSYAFSLNVDPK